MIIHYSDEGGASVRSAITVSLPEDVRAELDRYSREAGVTRSDVVRESVRDYLYVRRFRTLRERMAPVAAQIGVFTDQDVFDRVS
jgi:metal-responsive CopG/Arc/MetJ family transcriptional regulator